MAAIELRGGLLVEEAAIVLALSLENRGVTLASKDGALVASPRSALTTEDIAAIRAHRWHLLAISVYIPPEA